MELIGWGIIGLGFFGEKHAEVLSQMPDVTIAAVSTRRSERLTEIAERFNAPARYTDYRDLLADETVQVVSVVTHIDHHRDITIAALQAGKHVFLEKPMAGTVEECEAIVEAARHASGSLMVGHICRFDPRVNQARQAVVEGRIGKVVSMHASRNLPAHISGQVLDKVSPLMGDGIHDTDIMLWLEGGPVKSVYAQNVRVRDYKHPDIGWAMMRFASGAIGVIETVWYLPENTPFTIDARMEVIGEKGALYIDCGNAGLTIHQPQGHSMPDTVYWPEVFERRVGALRYELEYFAQCVRQGKRPDVVSPEEALAAVAVMRAAEQSAASNTIVTL